MGRHDDTDRTNIRQDSLGPLGVPAYPRNRGYAGRRPGLALMELAFGYGNQTFGDKRHF